MNLAKVERVKRISGTFERFSSCIMQTGLRHLQIITTCQTLSSARNAGHRCRRTGPKACALSAQSMARST
jgi:hypothetical protein